MAKLGITSVRLRAHSVNRGQIGRGHACHTWAAHGRHLCLDAYFVARTPISEVPIQRIGWGLLKVGLFVNIVVVERNGGKCERAGGRRADAKELRTVAMTRSGA